MWWHSSTKVGWSLQADQSTTMPTMYKSSGETVHAIAVFGAGVWMNLLYGPASACDAATRTGAEHGITVIDGGCR